MQNWASPDKKEDLFTERKALSVPPTVAMIAGLLTECGSGDKAAETAAPAATTKAKSGETAAETATPEGGKKYDGVELTHWPMWANQEPQGQALVQVAEAFEAEIGVKVKFEWKGHETRNIFSSALGAQEKFDMFEDDYTRTSKNYMNYIIDSITMVEETGYADKNCSVFNSRATGWAGFLPYATKQPFVGGMFYNKNTFDDYGITAPKTWAEFMTTCQTMRDRGYQPLTLDSTYAPFLFGYRPLGHIGQTAAEGLTTNGGWSSNPGITEAGQEMIDFVKTGYLTDGAPNEYPVSQNKIGLAGKVGMIVCANYTTSGVNTNTGSETNRGLFIYPAMNGGVDNFSILAGVSSIDITRYSEDQQAAFDFTLYLTSGKQGQNLAGLSPSVPVDPSGTVPATRNGATEVLVNATAPPSQNMGLNTNTDKISVIQEVTVRLYEGSYTTGDGFAKALDASYWKMLESRRRRFMRRLIWSER